MPELTPLLPDGAAPSMAELLQSMAADNPQLQPLLHVLAMRDQVATAEDELEALEAPSPAGVDPARVRALLAEARELRRRNDELARALGACPLCWGRDLACPSCDGDGGPGSRRPVPALFDAWVAPALRRVAAARPRPVHPVRVGAPPRTSPIETEGA